jgi:anti-sigma regulatory factor (Ser/Thr protein kinase)
MSKPKTLPPPLLKISISPSLECLGPVGKMTYAIATHHGLSESSASELELAIVEALTNIVKHGQGARFDVEITLKIWLSQEGLTLYLSDSGSKIPEQALSAADGSVFYLADENVMNAPEGGMGLSLIKALVDEWSYTSHDGVNTLRLIKLREPRHAP